MTSVPELVVGPRVVRDDGRTPFLRPQKGVAPVDADDLATRGWALATFGAGVSDGDKGDITVSASGSTWLLNSNCVSNTKLRDSGAMSVIGRSANSIGDPADIAATQDSGAVLRESGRTLSFGKVSTLGLADDAVTNAILRNSAALSVIGRASNSSGDPADIAAGADHSVLRRSGTAIGFGAVNLAQSAAVTGALAIANGGTGSTSAGAALTALGAAAATHGHTDPRDIEIDTSECVGALAGSGVSNLKDLVDWLDANLTPP